MQEFSELNTEDTKKRIIRLLDNGLKYILRDLSILQDQSDTLPMSFPQILLVFSGIEFISALIYSNGKNTDKVDQYISEWMPANYNRKEGKTTLGRFLYDSLRSGLAHYGNVKGDIVVDHDEEARIHHLQWVPYKGRYRLFIHGNVFARHFEDSVKEVKKGITNNTISIMDIQSNSERLEKELEKSTRREPNNSYPSGISHEVGRRNILSQGSLPDTTKGTTYEGGN